MSLHQPESGRTRSGKYAHFCYEWDELLIDESDPEIETCCCYRDDKEFERIQEAWWNKRKPFLDDPES